jgi:hypothetical protein
LDQARDHPAKDIEDKISKVAEPIFDVIPKNIEEPHIPKDVKKSSVEKH